MPKQNFADKYLLKNRKNSLIIRTNFYGHSSDHKESYSEKIYSSLKKMKIYI